MNFQPLVPHRFLPLLLILLLTACGGSIAPELTPIPPPPTVNTSDGNSTAAADTPSPDLPEPTAAAGEETPDDTQTEDSNTSIPIPTPDVTPEPTPIVQPDPFAGATAPIIELQEGDPLPPIGRDLLFLADGALKRWSYQQGTIELLLPSTAVDRTPPDEPVSDHITGDITSFMVNADGKRAVAARLLSQEMLEEETRRLPLLRYEIIYLDLISLEQWVLVAQVTGLTDMALSPDGKQAAYVAANIDGGTPDIFDGESDDHIYYQPTLGGNAGPVQELAPCRLFCGSPSWHPENNLVAWGDGAGLWLFNIAGSEPQKLLDNQTDEINPATWLLYTPNSWANNGRALLLNKGLWEATAFTIFDIPTGNLIDIPDSVISYGPFPVEFSWMPDGRVLALRSFGRDGTPLHQLTIYRPDLEAGRLNLDEQIDILDDQPQTALAGLRYLENGRFAFTIFNWGETINQQTGLYHLTSFNETPEQVNGLPVPTLPVTPQISWSGDGRHALVHYPMQRTVYFAQAGGDQLFALHDLLGDNANAFTWLPEVFIP